MSDAALAAVSGLLGVALSGGVQVGLEAWRGHKIRRAAIRPVEGEMTGIIALLKVAHDHPGAGMMVLPQPEKWRTHQDILSRELPDRKWHTVSAAYAFYETLLTLNSTFKDSETTESRVALAAVTRTAIGHMDDAHRSLARRRWRRPGVDVVVNLGEKPERPSADGRESDC